MRKAHLDFSIVFNGDKLQLVCLGYDYVAEHEYGIKRLQESFGIEEKTEEPKGLLKYLKKWIGGGEKVGIEKYLISKVPNGFMSGQKTMTINKKRYKVYFFGTGYSWQDAIKNSDFFVSKIKGEMDFNKLVNGWWDEKSFLVASTDQQIINQLFEAFSKKDIAIWLSRSANPFAGSGLVLTIKSNLDQESLDKII